jgi:arsenate reductase
VNPFAIEVLNDVYNISAADAQSKSWETFGGTQFDFVITVCDNARESCPIWPGQPIVAHWGLPDPALASGPRETVYRTFKQVALQLQRRIDLFVSLPLEKLDRLKVAKLTEEIGKDALLSGRESAKDL